MVRQRSDHRSPLRTRLKGVDEADADRRLVTNSFGFIDVAGSLARQWLSLAIAAWPIGVGHARQLLQPQPGLLCRSVGWVVAAADEGVLGDQAHQRFGASRFVFAAGDGT